MEKPIDLAVVGGGSTAVSFLAQFVAELDRADYGGALRVAVFEPLGEVGPGEPYARDLPTNLLNIPAGRMSAYAERRGDFLEWINSRGPEVLDRYGIHEPDAGAFLPRPLFGEYLADVWRKLCARAGELGIRIDRLRARVDGMALDPAGGRLRLETSAGEFQARRAVLCNGNLPTVSYAGLQGRKGYFNSPYPVADLVRRVGRDARVGIIGSSLSAIDAIVALKESGHAGPMLAVSRSGRLPAVRSTMAPPTPIVPPTAQEITALVRSPERGLTLEDLYAFLSERLAATGDALDLADILGYGGSPKEALGREIEASSTLPRSWQAIAISLNEAIEHAWRLMPDAERRRFHADWRALWMTRRATFPMVNAVKIKRYLDEGGLRIHAGNSGLDIHAAGDGFEIRLPGAQGGTAVHRVDFVVNATGMSTDVKASRDPLVQSLLARGIAKADPYGGFGLDFDTGCLLDAKGGVVENISVLGSLAVGTYFWTMSLDVNARLALEQARRMAGELSVAGVAA
ncbi:FAD/NAD(P)-binding protein [Parapusillimonas granuli]|uniref:FAD/NAD(P)-binding protein n=1 Tax=Parapusillimonas granuli TaxID=380911 RepID=A0A853G0L3_9BURK|nr:FAD/NAD(P)-binding protein [Parapusillimonas granuli]MBB5215504.1 putative NAD(P)/FAD-binding protein YdhS [Parapusillimonas granuli]NYT49829.1 FAD/NAD(P)-binding protein [Parapusillimonas granuli]